MNDTSVGRAPLNTTCVKSPPAAGSNRDTLHEVPVPPPSGGRIGLPGIVHSRRARPPTREQRVRIANEITYQQKKVGIVIEPPPKANTTDHGWWTRACQRADWLWQRAPTFALLPVVGAAPDDSPAQKASEEAEPPGILVAEFDFWRYQSPQERRTEASTHDDLTPSLSTLVGSKRVHVMPNDSDAPFLRNVLIKTPKGMLISGVPRSDPQYGLLAHNAAAYFDKKGIRYEWFGSTVNFANVQSFPNFLLLADGNSLISLKAKRELTKVFGNPANVIHLELDAERRDSQGQQTCYDLDLLFLVVTNALDEKVVVVHPQCIKEKASRGRMGREEFMQALPGLGFKRVIQTSEEDHRNLVGNSLALNEVPGRLLLSSKAISKDLIAQFEKHHVAPILPTGDKVLGHPAKGGLAPYGIHCFTTDLPEGTEGNPEPERSKPRRPKPEKKEL